jgi:hypothetical protein
MTTKKATSKTSTGETSFAPPPRKTTRQKPTLIITPDPEPVIIVPPAALTLSIQPSRKTPGAFVGYLKVVVTGEKPYHRLLCTERPTAAEVTTIGEALIANYQAQGTIPPRFTRGMASLIEA